MKRFLSVVFVLLFTAGLGQMFAVDQNTTGTADKAATCTKKAHHKHHGKHVKVTKTEATPTPAK